MTVASTTASAGPFLGNGSTTAFPFTFKAMSTDEVQVTADGLEASGYTVTLNSGGNGGTVTFTTAPASGVEIYILADPDFTQDISIANNGPFLAEVVEEGFDRAAARDIVLKGETDRALKAPLGETLSALPTDRAGSFLAFDADGNPVASSGTGADAGLRTDLAASTGGSLVNFLQAGAAAAARSVQAKLRDTVSILDFDGVLGNDPTHDDTAAIAAGLAASVGKDIYVPSGNTFYISNLTGFSNGQRIYGGGCFKKFGTDIGVLTGQMITLPDAADGIWFDGIEFDGNRALFDYGDTVPAILGYLTRSLTVTHCYFHDIIEVGVKLRDGAGLHAAGNRFIDTMENGIEIHSYDYDIRTGLPYVGSRPAIQGNSTIIGNVFKGITRLEDADTGLVDGAGIALTGGALAPEWSSLTNYAAGQLAQRLDITYQAIAPSLNQQPPNATYWAVIGPAPRLQNIEIVGNHFEDCLRCIQHENNDVGGEGRNITIGNNTLVGGVAGGPSEGVYTKAGIVMASVEGCAITGNQIRNVGNHELPDTGDITSAGIYITGLSSDIVIANNHIIDDTGDAERTEHGIYVAAGTRITIKGNSGSGARSGFIQIDPAATDVRCSDNPGATGSHTWTGPVVGYEFGYDNLPSGTGNHTLTHDSVGGGNMDDLYLPVPGRIVAVMARLSENPSPGSVEVRPIANGTTETGAYVTAADYVGGSRGYKEVADPAVATQIPKGGKIEVVAAAGGLPSATNDLRVTVFVDHGWAQ